MEAQKRKGRNDSLELESGECLKEENRKRRKRMKSRPVTQLTAWTATAILPTAACTQYG